MSKSSVILLLFLFTFLVNCQKKIDRKITENDLKNKTFTLIFEPKKDSLTIQFKDSTHQIFEISEGEIPWRISHYDDSNFLVLDNRIIGISKNDKGSYDCKYIGLVDEDFTMTERKSRWKEEMIYGTWVETKYLTNEPDRTQVSTLSEGDSKNSSLSPPNYEITKDSIKLISTSSINESDIEINNTAEFITMKLYNDQLYGYEWSWKVLELNKNFMILQREITEIATIKTIRDTLRRKQSN